MRSSGRGRLVEDFFLGGLDFIVGRSIEVFNVFAVERRQRRGQDRRRLPAPLEHFQLAQSAFKPLAPPAQGLVDRFRR